MSPVLPALLLAGCSLDATVDTDAEESPTYSIADLWEELPAPGDTVRVRGVYDFGLRGGTVTVTKEGWLRAPK